MKIATSPREIDQATGFRRMRSPSGRARRGGRPDLIRAQVVALCMLLALVLATCPSARATLGEKVDTVGADRTALKAVQRASSSYEGYTVEEVASEAAAVREYVSSSGIVFGIAWNGHAYPDLTQLLGSYWTEYSAAMQRAGRKPGRRRLQLATENIVVEKWGHMRNLRGRAYVPALIPTGVDANAIK